MKLRSIWVILCALLLAGCNSTGSTLQATTDRISEPYKYESIKIPSSNPKEMTAYHYVFHAANKAYEQGYESFALVHEQKMNTNGTYGSSSIKALMFNGEFNIKILQQKESRTRKITLYGVFDSKEYKDSRYIPIGSVPGAV